MHNIMQSHVQVGLSHTWAKVVHVAVQSLSGVSQHKATRSNATPPGWDGSPLQITPPSILSCCPNSLSVTGINTPGWREVLQEENVLPKNTTQ